MEKLLTNSTNPNNGAGIRIDELRLATDWDSAVAGLVIPEPSTFALLGLAMGGGKVPLPPPPPPTFMV